MKWDSRGFTFSVELEGPVAGINGDRDGSNVGRGVLEGGFISGGDVDVAGDGGSDVLLVESAAIILEQKQTLLTRMEQCQRPEMFAARPY